MQKHTHTHTCYAASMHFSTGAMTKRGFAQEQCTHDDVAKFRADALRLSLKRTRLPKMRFPNVDVHQEICEVKVTSRDIPGWLRTRGLLSKPGRGPAGWLLRTLKMNSSVSTFTQDPLSTGSPLLLHIGVDVRHRGNVLLRRARHDGETQPDSAPKL